jgi:hypothetical protein
MRSASLLLGRLIASDTDMTTATPAASFTPSDDLMGCAGMTGLLFDRHNHDRLPDCIHTWSNRTIS